MRSAAILLLLATGAAALSANPIRKVVTLMQNMQKEIEAEGAKEKELFDKFMCYCSGNNGDLAKAAADGKAQIEQLSAQLKSEEAQKVQIGQDLVGHKSDREGAKGDIEEATVLRNKENAAFTAEEADSNTNIAAMANAIPALEKGMGGAALLQMQGGDQLHKLVQSYPKMDNEDRRNVLAFIEQSGDYAPQSGQIVGILKAMKDEMEADLKEAVADEAKSAAGFADLKGSKNKEVEIATEAIESKTVRAGELAVSVVQTADSLEDTQKEVADTEKFAAQLESQCATKEKEWAERCNARANEVEAISEAISILNDDDALDTFKKASGMSLAQVSFLQNANGKASKARKAQAIIAGAARKSKSATLELVLFTLNSKLKAKSAGGFGEVIKMVDDMVVLLGKQQKEDDRQKGWCEGEFEKAADEEAATHTKMASVDAAISEQSDAIGSLMQQISDLTSGIASLDKAVADATEQRKEEHADFVGAMQMNDAALQLVGKAKNRMQKFYNPTLYKAAPKTERSMEQKTLDAGFVQLKSDVAPPPAPETFSGGVQKSGKSAGVIGMMDNIIKDLENDMKDAEYEEKTSQKDYGELMADSQATRAQDAKSLTGKEASKAETEDALMASKENRAATATDLSQVQTVIKDLHASCDFLMNNYDLRNEARTNEIESLKNAKAVLSGASFSL